MEMRLMFLGDIHGNFNLIHQYIKLYGIENAHIVQVGDFGVGFADINKEKRLLGMYHPLLVKNNVHLWVLRGNHDFKPYFDNDPFGFTNIHLVADYTVLNLADKNILFLGGAISIDREWRYTRRQREGDYTVFPGQAWWKDEIFILNEKKLNEFKNIDIVVTHNCPSYCIPDISYGVGPFVESIIRETGDKTLKDDILQERFLFDEAFRILELNNNIKFHYYGHFHKSGFIEVGGIKHRVLGIGELWEERD